jgi:hypothetical protein
MPFRETNAVYCENHTTQIHSVGGTQSFSVLKQVIYAEAVSFEVLSF